jgi:hypothetical protein
LNTTDPEILGTIFALLSFLLGFPEIVSLVRSGEGAKKISSKFSSLFEVDPGRSFFHFLLAIARVELTDVIQTHEVIAAVLCLAIPLYGLDWTSRNFFAAIGAKIRDADISLNLSKLSVTDKDDSLEFEPALLLVNSICDYDLEVVANLIGSLLAANNFKRDQENALLKDHLVASFEKRDVQVTPRRAGEGKIPIVALNEKWQIGGNRFNFNEIRDFPPLLFLTADFGESPTALSIKNSIRGIKIEPISDWFAEIARGKAKTVGKVPVNKEAVSIYGERLAQKLKDALGMPAKGPDGELHLHVISEGGRTADIGQDVDLV